MVQLYRVFLTILFSLVISGLFAQVELNLCDAEDGTPLIYGPMNQTQNLSGTIPDVDPFITSTSMGNIENFGTGADSAVFIRLELDPLASFLRIEWVSGDVDDLFVALIGFTKDCSDAADPYVVTLYENPDGDDLVSGNIEDGSVTFELCGLDPDDDYDNLYLWIATSDEDNGDFEISVTQNVRPSNDGCDGTPINLGTIDQGGDLGPEGFSNIWACRQNFAPTSPACAVDFNDGAAVWFEFTTGDEVGEINVLLENPDEVPVDIAIFENESGDCESFSLARRGCENDLDDEGIALENIAVKPNTTYFILVNTDPSDWRDNFSIEVTACDPPSNNLICDPTELDFPSLDDYVPGVYEPGDNVNFDGIGEVVQGTTECAYAFYNADPTADNSWFDFDCGHANVERAVFYKLNVDEFATKLYVEFQSSDLDGSLAVQVFLVQDEPGDCSDLIFDEGIFIPPAGWGSCDFGDTDVLEIDLCEVDNEDYGQLYLWVASAIDDEGEFELRFRQEVAPINDLCNDDSDPSRGATEIGPIAYGTEQCLDEETNRGACPIDFVMPAGVTCLQGFEDEPTVWYTFETGDNMELVDIRVNHTGNVRVAIFEMENECAAGNLLVPGNDLNVYCAEGDSEAVFEDLTVKSNTVYHIIISTAEEDWGEFSICIEACSEPPNNFDLCNAEELIFDGSGDDLAANTSGTTECAFGFYNDVDLNDLIDFVCVGDFESAVFYKLNVDPYATKLEIEIEVGSAGTVAAQFFVFDDIPDCDVRSFLDNIDDDDDFRDCDFDGTVRLEIDLCGIDNDLYDNLYLWVATSKEDQGTFSLDFYQEIAPVNDLCDDPSDPNREATDFGILNWNSDLCFDDETNRGACPNDFVINGAGACLGNGTFDDEAVVWYQFTTGDNVESINLEVEHPGVNVRVALFEMETPCEDGLNVPGDWEDYCDQAIGTVEFDQIRVKSNTTYFIMVSTSEDDWGQFSICIDVCEPPANYNVCEAEELAFLGLGGYDPDDPAVTTSGTTVCAYGFWDNEDLTQLISFNCGEQYEHAVFYKLNIDEFASKIEIHIDAIDAGTMSAHVFFWDGNEDCDSRGFDITSFMGHGECNFNNSAVIEIDFCPLWSDPNWADENLYENMYLWIATNKDDQGEFDIEVFQEIAPYNDDCENAPPRFPGNLGNIQVGTESCLLAETNRGACPILYTGPNACYQGFPDEDEAGVWYEFTTRDEVELITIEIDHSNASTVRIALYQLPDGCGQAGLIPGDIEEYCVEIANGIDSIWNILVQENTTYYILVSTPIDEWGDFDICVRHCEPPGNDKVCDALVDGNFRITPGEEEWNGPGNIDRNEVEIEGTTTCANNFFLDFELNYESFDCPPDFESAVFYKIEVDQFATEFTVTGFSNGPDNLAFGVFQVANGNPCVDREDIMPEIWFDFEDEIMLDCDAAVDGEIVFNLCGFSPEERDNLYLWVSTERKDQGDFEIQVSQKIGPPNDDCGTAEEITSSGQNNIMSDEDEEICVEGTTVWACSEFYSEDDIDVGEFDEVACFLAPLDPGFVGVWYEFTTDGNAGRYDFRLTFEDPNTVFSAVIFRVLSDCGEMEVFNCFAGETGELEFFNSGMVDVNGQPTTYKILIYTEQENPDDFELCINVKPPIECDNEPPFYYNHTTPICGWQNLIETCLTLQEQSLFPTENWAPYNSCGCCALHNPAWITFVAGEDGFIEIDLEITDCSGGFPPEGVQLAMYELDCDVDFDPTGESPGLWPDDVQLTPCEWISQAQIGVRTFTANATPGQVYGIVIDGYNGWDCNITIIDVSVGGDPPALDGSTIGEPEFEDIGFGDDTVCVGATDIPFSLTGEVEGACTYIWTLEDFQTGEITELETEDDATTVLVSFPEPGNYEVCVSASNLCDLTPPVCAPITVIPLDPYFVTDTICKREEYVWIGPFGETLGVYGPYDFDGDFEDETIAFNQFECEVPSFLDLYIVPDNIENKTPITAIICRGEEFEMPNGEIFTETGFYGEDDEIFITQISEPGATFECDSFFTLDLVVIDAVVVWRNPVCLEGEIILSQEFNVFPNPNFMPGPDESDIRWQWVKVSTGDTIAFGGTNIPNDPLDPFIRIDIEEWFGDSRMETFQFRVQMSYEGEPEEPCSFIAGEFTIDLDDFLPETPNVAFPPLVCTDNLVTLNIQPPFGSFPPGVDYIWDIDLDSSDYIVVNDTILGTYELIFLVEETVEICVTPINECGPGEPNCFEIEVSEPPISDAGPDDSTCELEYTMQSDGDAGFWTLFSGPTGVSVNYAPSNTDPNATISVEEYGEYVFIWTEQIAGLQNCSAFDTVTITFNQPPIGVNRRYTCDDDELFFTATFDIIGETGPYTIVTGSGTIDSATFTSEEIPDLGVEYVVIMDGNGCVSDSIRLSFRCDCPTAVGDLLPTTLQLCDGDCFETSDFYDDTNESYRPGLDTVVYFLQTTDEFSTDSDDWVVHNEDGIFCIDDLDINLDQIYYVYVAVGIIDTVTNFIDLDLSDPFNCTRITDPPKPIRWRAQPVAEAIDSLAICGETIDIQAIPSVGVGQWSVVSGPGMINFIDASDPGTEIVAEPCGEYTLRWREDNFVCSDSVDVQVFLNCFPTAENIEPFCDNDDISYSLTFEIENGAEPYEVISPAGFEDAITGNVFFDPMVDNRGEILDTFLIIDANGCLLEVIIDQNCDCDPDPGVMGPQINLCISQPNVTATVDQPAFSDEPEDIVSFVLHTNPGDQLGDIIAVDANGQFSFDFDQMQCNEVYYISSVIGPPDSTGTVVDFGNGCTRVAPGQPVLWYCEPTAEANDPDPICGIEVVSISGTSLFGTGSWSGGSGEFANPNSSNTNYTPDSSEIGSTVVLTYTTTGADSICPAVSVDISFFVDEERVADAGPDQIFCEIEPVQLDANSNGESGVWSGGVGTFDDPTLNNAVYTPDASEQGQIITLTWTTAEGIACPEMSDEMTIEIVDDLTSVPGEDFIACFLSTELVAELPGNLQGEWSSNDPDVMFDDVNSPVSGVTVPDLGTYCFTWTVSIGDCEDSDEVCVTFVDAPVLVDTILECNDIATEYFVTLIFEGGDEDSYTVNGEPVTGNSFDSDWIVSGQEVTFTINDANNCEPFVIDIRHVCECLTEVGVMSDPDAVELCEDESFDFSTFYDTSDEFLDPNDIRVYLLHDGDRDNVGNIISENTSGVFGFQAGMQTEQSYWVTVAVGDEDGNSGTIDFGDPCLLYSTGVEVIWYDYPDASIETPDILTCAVTEVTITAVTPEADHIEYNWSGPGVVSGQNERTVTVNSVGTYTLEVTDTRANCTSTETITVEGDFEEPTVVIETPLLLTCVRTSVEIDGSSSSSGNFTYEWSGPGIVSGENTPVVTVDEVGTYTLMITNNENGCVSEASMTVNEDVDFPDAVASVDAELDCSTNQVTVSAEGSSQGADFTYQWEGVSGGTNIVSGANEFEAVVSSAGTYRLIVTNNDNGCVSETTVEVIEITDVITGAFVTSSGINCFGDRDGVITIDSVVGGTAPYQYSFEGGAFGGTPQLSNVNAGTYSITIRDSRGCLFDTNITLTEPPLLEVDLGSNIIVELGESVTLEGEVSGRDPMDITDWIWNPEVDPGCPNCPDQEFVPLEETFVQLTVVDSNGCVANASITVFITVTRQVYIPNAFSPNGDGINDFLGVYAGPFRIREIKEFRIFDRWGEQVFHRENIPDPENMLNDTNAWDGTFDGELMDPGVFIYYILIEFADGVEEAFQGDFTLLR